MKRALVVLSLLFLTACSGPSDKEAQSAEGTPRPDQWVPAKPVKSDDVQVAIPQAGVEPAHVMGISNHADIFAVRLEISNSSHSKRFTYHTWAKNARLVDNFGNPYKLLPRPEGTGVDTMPINPAAPVMDILFFETPITTAKYVDLHLPAGNLGTSADIAVRIQLQTSGARLEAVTNAAKAVEAENKAKAAAIAAKEAEAKRAEERRKAEYRLTEENAKARQKEAELAAEKARLAAEDDRRADELAAERAKQEAEAKRRADALAAEKARQKAELEALPGRLAAAQADLVVAKDKMRMVKLAANSGTYTYSGAMPADYFDAGKKKYIYYGKSQRLARTKEVQDAIDKLIADIASFEARIAAKK